MSGLPPCICPHCGYDLVKDAPISIGEAAFDRDSGFSFRGQPVRLTPQLDNLVHSLMKAAGRTLTYDTLYNRLGIEESRDPRNLLRVHVDRARRRLDQVGAARFIQAEHGLGYRWKVERA